MAGLVKACVRACGKGSGWVDVGRVFSSTPWVGSDASLEGNDAIGDDSPCTLMAHGHACRPIAVHQGGFIELSLRAPGQPINNFQSIHRMHTLPRVCIMPNKLHDQVVFEPFRRQTTIAGNAR